MSPFQQLLHATIRHLEDLKGQGVFHVSANPATLEALRLPAPPRTTRISPPAARAATSSATTAAPPTPLSPQPTSAAIAAPRRTPTGNHPAPATAATPPPAIVNPRVSSPVNTHTPTANTSPLPPTPSDPAARQAAFEALRTRVLACQKCPHLATSRKNVVFGVGDPTAQLMFVGEAPGADEDEQAEPFVGKAGQLLTRIIQTMGLSRDRVFIANILKCRPDTPGQTAGNRKPTADEMATCSPYLIEQIALIQPRVLVALGATAVEGLLGKTVGITRLRGTWQEYRGIPLMPTYHPAYLLRNQSLSEKRKVWEDMLAVMERLEMPISEKQRAYFQ